MWVHDLRFPGATWQLQLCSSCAPVLGPAAFVGSGFPARTPVITGSYRRCLLLVSIHFSFLFFFLKLNFSRNPCWFWQLMPGFSSCCPAAGNRVPRMLWGKAWRRLGPAGKVRSVLSPGGLCLAALLLPAAASWHLCAAETPPGLSQRAVGPRGVDRKSVV